jgi:hypothetical protein
VVLHADTALKPLSNSQYSQTFTPLPVDDVNDICPSTKTLNHSPRSCLMEDTMPRTVKTWADERQAKPPHTVRLDKNFAGVPAGSLLLISSPLQMEDYLRTQVPVGTTKVIQQVRRELAAMHSADATCPVSTSFFLRTVAEAA